ASVRRARIREVLARIAPDDLDVLPGHVENFGRDAGRVDDRVSSEVADSRLHIELAVGTDRHQAVVTDRVPADKWTDRDSQSAGLRAVAFAAARLAFVPPKELDSAIDRLRHEGARDVAALAILARPSEWCLA